MITEDTESELRRRLRWQCRRGLLELDLLFTRFLDNRYAQLTGPEKTSFQTLLKQSDHNLLAWLHGQKSPPGELQSILKKIM